MPSMVCEMIVARGKPNGPEWAKTVSSVKPYADVDLKVPSRPSDEEIQAKQDAFVDMWVRAIAPGVVGKTVTAADVKVATRHRYVANTDGGLCTRVFKLSFRLFLPGVSTTPKAVEHWMNKGKLFDGKDSAFDKSVYSTTRKMCMVFGKKSASDPTPLTPIGEDLETLDPLDYVIQYTEQDWPTLAIQELVCIAGRPVPSGLGLNDSSEDDEMTEAMDDADFRMCRPMLLALGFSQVQLSGSPNREEGGIKFYNFTCSNRSDCPCCHQPHDSNRWFVQVVPSRSVSVKNHSSRCRTIDLFADRPADPFTKAMVDRPSLADRHKDYAERFASMGQEYVFPYVQDGRDFLAFNGSRWEAVKVGKREPPRRTGAGMAVLPSHPPLASRRPLLGVPQRACL